MSGFINIEEGSGVYRIESTLPYEFYQGSAVALNGEIHILGGSYGKRNHYKYSNGEWTSVSTLPYEFYRGAAVVLNGEIHILGGGDSSLPWHFKYSNGSWEMDSRIPIGCMDFSAVVLNGEIHVLGGFSHETAHYKYSNGSWTSVSTLPYDFYDGSAIVLNDEIHILGGWGSSSSSYKDHYKYSGGSWTSVSTLPYEFCGGLAIILNNEIHILGSSYPEREYYHYKYFNNEWTNDSTLPESCQFGSVVLLDNGINVLGGGSERNAHYSYNIPRRNVHIIKSWIPVPNKSVQKYIQTEDTDYVSGKVYYKLIDNEYIPVDSNEEPWSSEYYENHPTRQYSLKRVNRAWVGDSNGVPKLVLDRPQNNWKLLLDSNDAFFTDDRGDQYVFTSAIMDGDNIRLFSGSGLKNKIYDPRTGMFSIDNSAKEQDYIHERYFHATGNNIATKDENDNIYVMSAGNQDSCIAKKTKIYSWQSQSALPYDFCSGSTVVYGNKIHILGGGIYALRGHYSWDGTQWAEESILPVDLLHGSAVVYDNKIHILANYRHYSWNGTQWTEESSALPYNFEVGSAVVYDNKIHILGGYYGYTNHYSWNGTQWTEESTLPYELDWGSAVVYDNKIHILGGFDYEPLTNHYSWDGTQWAEESILPYGLNSGSAVVYDNKIHILGGIDHQLNHYSWDGAQWTEMSNLPYSFYSGSAVVSNGEIHILGSEASGYYRSHYFGSEVIQWVDLTTFPSEIQSDVFRTSDPSMFVKNNKLYFILETLRSSVSYDHCLVYYDLTSGTWNTNLSINSPMTIEDTNTHSGYSYFIHDDIIYITFGGLVSYFDETNRIWVGVPGFNVKTNMGTMDERHTLCSYYDNEYYNISICELRDRIPKDIVKFRFTPHEPYVADLTCDTSLVGDTRNQVRLSDDSFLINNESGTKMYAVVQTLNKNNTRNLKIYEYNPEDSEKFY